MSDVPKKMWREAIPRCGMYPDGGAFYHESPPKVAAVEYVRADLERRWQPIETAPKDTIIDIWLSDNLRWCGCYYDRICGEWRTSRPSGKLVSIREAFVTHWMHTPAPPAVASNG